MGRAGRLRRARSTSATRRPAPRSSPGCSGGSAPIRGGGCVEGLRPRADDRARSPSASTRCSRSTSRRRCSSRRARPTCLPGTSSSGSSRGSGSKAWTTEAQTRSSATSSSSTSVPGGDRVVPARVRTRARPWRRGVHPGAGARLGLAPGVWRAARGHSWVSHAGLIAGLAFRGFRLTRASSTPRSWRSGPRVLAEDEGPSAYRFSRDRFLRLTAHDRRHARRLRRAARRRRGRRAPPPRRRALPVRGRPAAAQHRHVAALRRRRPRRRARRRPGLEGGPARGRAAVGGGDSRAPAVVPVPADARRLPRARLRRARPPLRRHPAERPRRARGSEGGLYGLRHDLVLVAAYFLGRSVPLDIRRLRWTIAGAAAAVAAWG